MILVAVDFVLGEVTEATEFEIDPATQRNTVEQASTPTVVIVVAISIGADVAAENADVWA